MATLYNMKNFFAKEFLHQPVQGHMESVIHNDYYTSSQFKEHQAALAAILVPTLREQDTLDHNVLLVKTIAHSRFKIRALPDKACKPFTRGSLLKDLRSFVFSKWNGKTRCYAKAELSESNAQQIVIRLVFNDPKPHAKYYCAPRYRNAPYYLARRVFCKSMRVDLVSCC